MGKTCGGKSISAEALLIQLSHLDLVWKSIDWEMDGRVDCKQESHFFFFLQRLTLTGCFKTNGSGYQGNM